MRSSCCAGDGPRARQLSRPSQVLEPRREMIYDDLNMRKKKTYNQPMRPFAASQLRSSSSRLSSRCLDVAIAEIPELFKEEELLLVLDRSLVRYFLSSFLIDSTLLEEFVFPCRIFLVLVRHVLQELPRFHHILRVDSVMVEDMKVAP